MAVFEPHGTPGHWRPTPLAAGPFAGLQGGAVAGLLTAEIEARAAEAGWGVAVSAAAWFLRPTPAVPLRTRIAPVHAGGRVSVVDNTLWPAGEAEPCATVRVTLLRERPIEVPGLQAEAGPPADPAAYPSRRPVAPHGGPWFMDAMEVRGDDSVAWFRMRAPVIDGAGPLSVVLGPADWAHGIARPVRDVVADPNPNLTVHLLRPPVDGWIGLRPHAWWEPNRGRGVGGGTLLDRQGGIGSVSMAVALVPFPARPPVSAAAV